MSPSSLTESSDATAVASPSSLRSMNQLIRFSKKHGSVHQRPANNYNKPSTVTIRLRAAGDFVVAPAATTMVPTNGNHIVSSNNTPPSSSPSSSCLGMDQLVQFSNKYYSAQQVHLRSSSDRCSNRDGGAKDRADAVVGVSTCKGPQRRRQRQAVADEDNSGGENEFNNNHNGEDLYYYCCDGEEEGFRQARPKLVSLFLRLLGKQLSRQRRDGRDLFLGVKITFRWIFWLIK